MACIGRREIQKEENASNDQESWEEEIECSKAQRLGRRTQVNYKLKTGEKARERERAKAAHVPMQPVCPVVLLDLGQLSNSKESA